MSHSSRENGIESQQNYYEHSFNKLELSDEDISHSEFEACEFYDCDFSSSRFERCKFINCRFERCNLSLVNLTYTRVFELEFVDCKLVGIDWTRAHWPSFNLDHELSFKRCILNDCSFFGLTLNELKLEECKLHDADLREADLAHATLTYCDFHHALFMRTNLNCADLTESTNFHIDVLENTLTKAKFSRYEALALLESLGIELVD